MNKLIEAIKHRKSCRNFSKKKVSDKQIKTILEIIVNTPSAGGLNSYNYCFFTQSSTIKSLISACYNQTWLVKAPVVMVFSADKTKGFFRYGDRAELYSIQDATIACAHAQIAAEALGLSSCWVGAFDETAIKKKLGLINNLRPIAILAIGYKKRDR